MSREKQVAIFGSGTGTNARAILQAAREGRIGGAVELVVSDVPDAGILKVAEEFGASSIFIDPGVKKGGRLSDAAIEEIVRHLDQRQIDLVVLAGFMRIVRDPLISAYEGRILNIHPSLLPKYPGLNTVKRAMDAGDTETGCTIHLVDRGVDTGEILRQERVPIFPDDSIEAVYARIQEKEHMAYPEVIAERLSLLS